MEQLNKFSQSNSSEIKVEVDELKAENDRLRAENKRLRSEKVFINNASKRVWRLIRQLGLGIRLEKKLNSALKAWLQRGKGDLLPIDETTEAVSVIITSIVRRRFAVFSFGLAITILSTYFLWKQTEIMETQSQIMLRQDEALKRQNKLIAIERMSQIRDLFIRGKTDLGTDRPNYSAIFQVVELARQEPTQVQVALESLTGDKERIVVASALIALHRMDVRNFQALLLRDLDLSGVDLKNVTIPEVNLAGSQLVNAKLSGSVLRNGKFGRADFTGADLSGTDFNNSQMNKAIFEHAILKGCDFSGANLDGAQFNNADLTNAIFDGARLDGANFKNAILTNTSFERVKPTSSIPTLE